MGGLSGHLKGHSTWQTAGCIEMDGPLKVEPASLVWKCAFKSEPPSAGEYRCQNECWPLSFLITAAPASQMHLFLYFSDLKGQSFPSAMRKTRCFFSHGRVFMVNTSVLVSSFKPFCNNIQEYRGAFKYPQDASDVAKIILLQ